MTADDSPFVPNWASPPGESVREAAHHRGLTLEEFGSRTGLPPHAVADLVAGRLRIMPELAERLEQVVGGTARFWLRREAQYLESLGRLAHARADAWPGKPDYEEIIDAPPGGEAENPWTRALGDVHDRLVDLERNLGGGVSTDDARLLHRCIENSKFWKHPEFEMRFGDGSPYDRSRRVPYDEAPGWGCACEWRNQDVLPSCRNCGRERDAFLAE